MRKNIFLAAIALFLSLTALAGPAKPGRIVYTQPDGSTIGIYLHGDEFYHWMTDDSGRIVVSDDDGFIGPVGEADLAAQMTKMQETSLQRARFVETMRASASNNNFGSPEIPVLLIGFSDYPIKKTTADFNAMLNTPGYSDNGAIGSVFDYYNENSFGQFTPHFDVIGSVNLSSSVSTYGSNENNAYKALIEACEKLDSSVDFSRYDNDGDGVIDFFIFYFGGYDEAQCPQTSSYTKFIWSHATNISSLGKKFDGKTVGKYFCTSELKNFSGSTMCSIGTTCHEFAHTLGLPDFYDVAYQNGSTSSQAANMYDFDLMASGSYNGDSTTPPYLNAEELMEIGWLTAIPEITSNGQYILPSLNEPDAESHSAYMTKTSVSNEYFVYETRGGRRWDAYLPTGLLVYHVDKSTNRISGSTTAASVWSNNYVNSYAAHPCCYVVPASNPTQTTLFSGLAKNMVFGTGYKSYSPTAWNGNSTGFQLTAITYSNGTTTFNVVNSNALGINGVVLDSDSNPISGVTVTVEPGTKTSSVQKKSGGLLSYFAQKVFLSSKKRLSIQKRAVSVSAVTDDNGYYSVDLESAGTYNVTAAKEGYVSQTAIVDVTSVIETQNFYLMRQGESLPSELIPFPEDEDGYLVGTSLSSLIGENMFPVSEIGKYAGKQIKSISFYLYGDSSTTFDDVYAIIDYDEDRKATVRVDDDDVTINGWTTVDLREHELIIPSGKDIFAGAGVQNWSYYRTSSDNTKYYLPFVGNYLTEEDEDGNEFVPEWAEGWPYKGYAAEFNVTSTGTRYDFDVVFWMYLTIGDYKASDSGYNFIDDPQGGEYSSGDVLPLNLILTEEDRKPAGPVEWFFDDEPVSGTSVILLPGSHVVTARFTTAAGTRKVVELELEVH